MGRTVEETPDEYAERIWTDVTVEGVYSAYINYVINDEEVRLYKDAEAPRPWVCSCIHTVWVRNKPDEICRHVKAVRTAIKNKGAFKWKKEKKQRK